MASFYISCFIYYIVKRELLYVAQMSSDLIKYDYYVLKLNETEVMSLWFILTFITFN